MSPGRDGEASGEVGRRAAGLAPGMLLEDRAHSVLLCVAGRKGRAALQVSTGRTSFPGVKVAQ